LSGSYLDLGRNPYFQGAIGRALAPVTENFTRNILPGVQSQFEGAGRYASGADRSATEMALNSFNRATADAATQAANQAYGQERQNQLATQRLLPSFQGMDLARAGALQKSGQMIDEYDQKLRDEGVMRDIYGKTGNLDYWSSIASRILGAYP